MAMFYHVTDDQGWDGEDLVCLDGQVWERPQAVRWYMQRWDCEDVSLADDQVTKVHLYRTLDAALEHQSMYGGEILEVDGRYLDIYPNFDGNVYVWTRIASCYISRLS